MKNISCDEKNKPAVRESALEHGLSYLFDEELLMLILGAGNGQMPVEIMADRILEVLDDSDPADIVEKRYKSMGKQALAIVENTAVEETNENQTED